MTPLTVTLDDLPLMAIWNIGELVNVTFSINTLSHSLNAIMRGRLALFTFAYGHQGDPCPSMVPFPVMAMSCRFDPLIKSVPVAIPPGYRSIGNIFIIAPESIWRSSLLPNCMGPHINACWNEHFPASGIFCCVDRFLEGRGVVSPGVANCAKVLYIEDPIWNGRQYGRNEFRLGL